MVLEADGAPQFPRPDTSVIEEQVVERAEDAVIVLEGLGRVDECMADNALTRDTDIPTVSRCSRGWS